MSRSSNIGVWVFRRNQSTAIAIIEHPTWDAALKFAQLVRLNFKLWAITGPMGDRSLS